LQLRGLAAAALVRVSLDFLDAGRPSNEVPEMR
jgi:hypothetical protein